MLDAIIHLLDSVNCKAHDINSAIKTQQQLLIETNDKCEKARRNLEKRGSALNEML